MYIFKGKVERIQEILSPFLSCMFCIVLVYFLLGEKVILQNKQSINLVWWSKKCCSCLRTCVFFLGYLSFSGLVQ